MRVRPGNGKDRTVQKVSGTSIAIGDRTFSFDSVLGPQASQVILILFLSSPKTFLSHNEIN